MKKRELALSLIIPTVNRGELFRSPIESILPQLQSGDELIVSINGQRESVENIIDSYAKELNGISVKLVSPPKKLNIYEHWNFAISQASHRECVFIHDDEIYHSRLLDIAREEFTDPETTLVTGGHIRVIAPSMASYKTIEFNERKKIDKGMWYDSQAHKHFPKYGCTAYIFRKREEGYPFFEANTRVSDALLMYAQSYAGKVVERKEFFGTRLLHEENTSHTDYLELNHTPFWKGLENLASEVGSEKLAGVVNDLKKKAVITYSNNAIFSALPRGDKAGFNECIRQCFEAGDGPSTAVKLLSKTPGLWIIGPKLLSMLKRLKHVIKPKYKSSSGEGISEEDVITELNLINDTWSTFCERVRSL